MNTVSNEMKLATTRNFGSLAVEVYENPQREFFMTREQVGTALEYGNPGKAIQNIHVKNADRLDPLSTFLNLRKVEGNRTVERNLFAYNFRGVMEICRLSRQPKADAFMDFCWDVMTSLMRGETVSLVQSKEEIQAQRQARFDTMVKKLDSLIECQKQDRAAIDNVLYVCKQLSQQVQALQAQGGNYTPRKNPKGMSEWRTELYDIVHKIARLSGSTVNGVMSWGYTYLGTNYGWFVKDARREYIEKFGYKGDVKDLSGVDIIEASDMYRSIFMSIMKDKLEQERHDSECKKGIVNSFVKSKHPPVILADALPYKKHNTIAPVVPASEVVVEAHAIEIEEEEERPKKKYGYVPSPLKPVVDPIAEKLNDRSWGHQQTYRKIYEIVGVSQIDRMTRKYLREHNKPPKSKAVLFMESEKSLNLFKSAAKKLATSI